MGSKSDDIYLKFCNRTSRKIDIITSRFSKFATLDPGKFCYVHTYKEESWLSKDSKTNTNLLLNNVKQYFPPAPEISEPRHQLYTLSMFPRQDRRHRSGTRVIVNITEPMLTLQHLCAETVAKQLRTPDEVENLPLPIQLKTVVTNLAFTKSTTNFRITSVTSVMSKVPEN